MHKIITDADSAPSYCSAPPPNVEKQIDKLQCVLFVVFHTFLEIFPGQEKGWRRVMVT